MKLVVDNPRMWWPSTLISVVIYRFWSIHAFCNSISCEFCNGLILHSCQDITQTRKEEKRVCNKSAIPHHLLLGNIRVWNDSRISLPSRCGYLHSLSNMEKLYLCSAARLRSLWLRNWFIYAQLGNSYFVPDRTFCHASIFHQQHDVWVYPVCLCILPPLLFQ